MALLDPTIDALGAMVSHRLTDLDVAGLGDKFFGPLAALDGDKKRRVNAFELLCLAYESYLTKILRLTSASPKPKALYSAVLQLELLTRDEAAGKVEKLLEKPDFRYSIGRTYELRNQAAHFATGWPSSRVAEGIEHVLIAYLQATRTCLPEYQRRFPRAVRLSSPLVAHEEHTRGFAGFLEFLLPAKLPFVAPERTESLHPIRILDAVRARENQGGVILVGVGGAGKTRTSLEVATLATSSGYRVMHALPGEPALTVNDIADAALSNTSMPLLVVLDYLEYMPRLDLAVLRHRLLPELCERGRRIALLACSRPAWLLTQHSERDALFVPIELRTSAAHAERIGATIRGTVAPAVVRALGDERVAQLAGQRPIIALFICRELERRRDDPTLADLEGREVHDLSAWLRRRLLEDGLIPTTPGAASSEGAFTQAVTATAATCEPLVVAATAALASAPLHRQGIVASAASTLRTLGLGRPEETADAVVGHLERLGWLEERGGELAVAHDVVADELLAGVAWNSVTDAVRSEELSAVLSGGLNDPRVLSRLAASLSRVAGAAGPERVRALGDGLNDWVPTHTHQLSGMFLKCHPNVASYALGSLLSGPPFAGPILRQWHHIVRPWLDDNRKHVGARHLLYRGLQAGHGERLVEDALAWLEVHGEEPSATFVLGPLLRLAAPPPQAVQAAERWLRLNGQLHEAFWLLGPLLTGGSTEGSAAATAFERWLSRHRTTPAAASLYAAVLRTHPTPLPIRLAEKALDWVGPQNDEGAQRVLQALFRRDDLSAALRSRVASALLEAARETLDRPGTRQSVRMLVGALRDHAAELSTSCQGIFGIAAQWLENNATHLEADWWVASRVLRQPKMPDELWARCAAAAIAWIDANPNAECVDFTLNGLLRRTHLLTDAQCDRVLDTLISWAQSPGAEGENPVDSLKAAARGLKNGPHEAKATKVQAALQMLSPSKPHVAEPGTFLRQLHVGQEVDGVVKAVVSYGAFVELGSGALDALLHASEAEEWSAYQPLGPGGPIRCRILHIDIKRARVQLTQRMTRVPSADTMPPSSFENAPPEVRLLYQSLGELDILRAVIF